MVHLPYTNQAHQESHRRWFPLLPRFLPLSRHHRDRRECDLCKGLHPWRRHSRGAYQHLLRNV